LRWWFVRGRSKLAALGCRRIIRATAFVRAAHLYWLGVFPHVQSELTAWRRRAEQIPDDVLRGAAFDALTTKRADLEGAVAFAVFAPQSIRGHVVRAITAFEIAFDYMDSIVELPNRDPIASGHSLNQALLVALSPGLQQLDYYKHYPRCEDAGYLEGLVRACQGAVGSLPSFAAVAEPVHRALSRIMAYQSLNHGDASGSHDVFERWARSQAAHSKAVRGADLHWWELGAAAGSQLAVLALIAAAGDPAMCHTRATALEHAYFPWIGALSTLLDGMIDQRQDNVEGQRSLIDNYSSPQIASERLRLMAFEARRAVLPLRDAPNHTMILAAMAAFFHSTPQALAPEVGLATKAVLDAMGGWATPALLFFRARRALARDSPTYNGQSYPTTIGSRPTTGNPDTSFPASSRRPLGTTRYKR
jgi:tetraprenyl-beta-curcumene synthase